MKISNLKYYTTLIGLSSIILLSGCSNSSDSNSIVTLQTEVSSDSIENENNFFTDGNVRVIESIVEEEKQEETKTEPEEDATIINSVVLRYQKEEDKYYVEFKHNDTLISYSYSNDYLGILNVIDSFPIKNICLENCIDSSMLDDMFSHSEIELITLDHCDFKDINFIHHFSNLKDLRVYNCMNISDITGLKDMNTLESLQVLGTTVSDISVLSSLSNLKHLDLRCNYIADSTPISGLDKLESLALYHNKFSSIDSLEPLIETGIMSEDIANLTLESCKKDSILIYSSTKNNDNEENYIDDFDALFVMYLDNKDSYYIELRNKEGVANGYTVCHDIHDIDYLFNFLKCRFIVLKNCSDMDMLNGIYHPENVESLSIISSYFTDIEFIRKFQHLVSLKIVDCDNFNDLSPLENLNNLQSLDMTNTLVSDIDVLGGLDQIQALTLAANKIEDISSIVDLPHLKSIYLTDNNITDAISLQTLVNRGLISQGYADSIIIKSMNHLENIKEMK